MNLAARIDALPSPIRESEGPSRLVTVGERSVPHTARPNEEQLETINAEAS
jgi:hypothetical protein